MFGSLTDRINFSSFNDFEPTISVILIIRRPGQGGSNSSMDIGVVFQQPFHCRMVEVGPVVDASNLAGRSSKDLGLPRITIQFQLDRDSIYTKISSKPTGDCQSE